MRCKDEDCRDSSCLGNRLELVGFPSLDDDGTEVMEEERVRILGVHHKNDGRGRGGDGNIDILLPLGPLNDLFLFWIRMGWGLISSSSTELFRSHGGNAFSSSTFTQYWKLIMGSAQHVGLDYFPPNISRTSYVDGITQGEFILDLVDLGLLEGMCIRTARQYEIYGRSEIDHDAHVHSNAHHYYL